MRYIVLLRAGRATRYLLPGQLLIKVTSGELYRNVCVNLTCWRREMCPVDGESKQECVGAVLEFEGVCQVG